MRVIEIETTLKDGIVEIPDKYKEFFNKKAKVILYFGDEEPSTGQKSIIKDLLKNPLSLPYFVPFSREEIYER